MFFSAAQPSLDPDGTLYYADYDEHGYQPVAVGFDEMVRTPASFANPRFDEVAERNSRQAAALVTPMTAEADSLRE